MSGEGGTRDPEAGEALRRGGGVADDTGLEASRRKTVFLGGVSRDLADRL